MIYLLKFVEAKDVIALSDIVTAAYLRLDGELNSVESRPLAWTWMDASQTTTHQQGGIIRWGFKT
ncbi:hypothetical protein EJ03DRAFT_328655 [Teratosphaeria nubilosa]|uniref:Uncharacterized protein n=1 Tax=Teratosphaeria nubilosa TaxID=161662 RepID=A0A6G1L599_9PEZI|nr:hypothetical protein EJ03DRAFT_328655 [Teratosphaeria nubilosa]